MTALKSKFQDLARNLLYLDARAIAITRILLGFIFLMDLSIRASDLEAHYTDNGILPLSALFNNNWNSWYFSILTISGNWVVQAFLFALSGVAGICLLSGFKTRLASFFCWIFLLSIHNRNPLILQGGDDLLRLCFFWGIFLPWGRRYSLDSLSKPEIDKTNKRIFSLPGVGFLIQILSVYFFSAMLKTSPEWRTEGTALYYALSLDQMILPLGKLIYTYPGLLKFLTITTWYIELIAPALFLIPFYARYFRLAGILLIIGLHAGIGCTLFVGLFFLIGISTIIALMPTFIMDRAESRFIKFFTANARFVRKWCSLPIYFLTVANYKLKIKPELEEKLKLGFARDLFLMVVIAYCLVWNFGTLPQSPYELDDSAKPMGYLFRFDQNWSMFAPSVFKEDGWYILDATPAIDTAHHLDLFRNGQPLKYSKPDNLFALVKNDRWRKYYETFLYGNNTNLRLYFCNYSLKEWNRSHKDNPIKELKIIYMREMSLPDYKIAKPERTDYCTCTAPSHP